VCGFGGVGIVVAKSGGCVSLDPGNGFGTEQRCTHKFACGRSILRISCGAHNDGTRTSVRKTMSELKFAFQQLANFERKKAKLQWKVPTIARLWYSKVQVNENCAHRVVGNAGVFC
jgi:hypothetical protein